MKKRLFIAIPLSESWLDAFGDFQKRCDKEFDLKDERDFRWTKVDNLHITICFLGWIEDEKLPEISQRLKEVLERVKHFELEFEEIIFAPPHRTPYMIWGVFKDRRQYQELVKSVNEAMREFSEEVVSEEGRESIPHSTLARFKDKGLARTTDDIKSGGEAKKEEMLKLFSTKETILKVNNIQLMESKLSPSGLVYTIIKSFYLL